MGKKHRSIILICLVIMVALLSSCGDNPTASYVRYCGSPTPSTTAVITDKNSATLSNTALLKRAIANNRKLNQYHLEYVSHDGAGETSVSGEIDALHKRSSMYASIKDGSFYLITIGNDDYLSEDNITYTKIDTGTSEEKQAINYVGDVLNSFDDDYIDSIAEVLNYNPNRDEQLDGLAVTHMAEDPTKMPQENGKSAGEEEFWVTKSAPPTLVQLKMVVNSKRGGGPYDITIKWSNLNQCIDIESPV